MCLYANITKTAAFVKKHKKSTKIVVYKVIRGRFDPNNSDPNTNIRYAPCSWHWNFFWKPGVNRSGAKIPKSLVPFKEINKGIHVFLSRKHAAFSGYNSNNPGQAYIMPLSVDLADLIAVSDTEAVFTKVTLNESTYKKLVKAMNALG